MNILEALEKKRALEDYLQGLRDYLSHNLNDLNIMSDKLIEIESCVDDLCSLSREIDRAYERIPVSGTETIADIVSYSDAITLKIEVLKDLILESNKKKIEAEETQLNHLSVLKTIQYYEDLRHSLIQKIKKVCLETDL